MSTLRKQMTALAALDQYLNVDEGNYMEAEGALVRLARLYDITLNQVKEDLLKVSNIQGAAKTLLDKPIPEIDLIVLHNTYAHLTALSGCIYTKPEDFDPVHTLACINDCLAFILVMQELHHG